MVIKLLIKWQIFLKSFRGLHSQNNEANGEIEIRKERYISPEKRQKLLMN